MRSLFFWCVFIFWGGLTITLDVCLVEFYHPNLIVSFLMGFGLGSLAGWLSVWTCEKLYLI